MLVLSRKEHERIMIGDGVEVVVLAVHGQRVKLGIQAAPDIKIERPEQLWRRVSREAVAGAEAR